MFYFKLDNDYRTRFINGSKMDVLNGVRQCLISFKASLI